MSIGLKSTEIKKVSDVLNELLSDLYVLMTKTKNYHWNLKGHMFYPWHKLMQEQYEALDEAIDEVAERIQMVGGTAIGSLKEFQKRSTLKEHTGKIPSENKAIMDLLGDNEEIAMKLRKQIPIVQKQNDEGSADLLIRQIQMHEKAAWMLRSSLAK